MKDARDGELAGWSCLQHKQLGRNGENLAMAQGEAGSWLPWRAGSALHSWSYSVGSGTSKLSSQYAVEETLAAANTSAVNEYQSQAKT